MRQSGWVIVLCMIIATFITSVAAQERGQYTPGTRGLNPADQPSPGITVTDEFVWYPTSTYKNADGRKVSIRFSNNIVFHQPAVAWTPKQKFLGAIFSASISPSIVTQPLTIPQLRVDSGGRVGVGDTYVEPISLGWELKKAKVRTAYGFVAPTGRYDEGANDNLTSDYWGHEFTLGGSYYPDKANLWQISVSGVLELHHKKRHEDVKVGHNVTFEYGIGKTFVKNKGKRLLQFGIVGYSEFQLTKDRGANVSPLSLGNKDRVHAIGPEFGVILPQKKFNVLVRLLPEYGARARTQGLTLAVEFGKTF